MDRQDTSKSFTRGAFFWLLLSAAATMMAVFGAGWALARSDENLVAAAWGGTLPGMMAFVLAVGLVGFAYTPAGKVFALLEFVNAVLLVLAFLVAYVPIRGYARHLGFDDGADLVLPLLIYCVIVLSVIDLRRIRRTR
ncbi:hypothetical protein AB0H49_34065 [Nocardia sp. NPDC050713]|uniref:hypothetical protein n=1 Tax=Nocardia sp. NPDC050713 TaxID=3154511 RepID=UPI0033DD5303